MSLENTFFIGMRRDASEKDRPFGRDTLVFWDKSQGVRGYQVVEGKWETNPDGTYSGSYPFWRADQDPDQTDQPAIACRKKVPYWLWTKEPVQLFSGLKASYITTVFQQTLVEIAQRQGYSQGRLFEGLAFHDELYDRPVKIACATEAVLHERQIVWQALVEQEVDWRLPECLRVRVGTSGLSLLTRWLVMYLPFTTKQTEEGVLRYLLVHPEEKVNYLGFMAFIYRGNKKEPNRRLDLAENLERELKVMKERFRTQP